MEVTFIVQVIPLQNMSWLKWKVSNQADSSGTLVNMFSCLINESALINSFYWEKIYYRDYSTDNKLSHIGQSVLSRFNSRFVILNPQKHAYKSAGHQLITL